MHENEIETAVDLSATVRNEARISTQFRLPLNERWNHTNHSQTDLNTPPCLSASVRNRKDRTIRLHSVFDRRMDLSLSHGDTEMPENEIETAVDLSATVRNEARISAQFRRPLNERWNHPNHSRTALNTPPCLSASVRNRKHRTIRLHSVFDRRIDLSQSHGDTEMHENEIATAVDLAATVRNEALISAQFRLPLNERWNHTNHSRTALNTPPCLSASVRNLRDRTKRSSEMEYHLLTFNVRQRKPKPAPS